MGGSMYTPKIGETHMSRDKLKWYNGRQMQDEKGCCTRDSLRLSPYATKACYYNNNFALLLNIIYTNNLL